MTDLVSICEAHLHGPTSMLDGGEGGGPGAAVMPADLDDVGVGLGHTAGHCSNASLCHQLH